MTPSQALRHPWLRRRLPRAPESNASVEKSYHQRNSGSGVAKLPPAAPTSGKTKPRRQIEEILDDGRGVTDSAKLNTRTVLPKIVGR